MSRELSALKPVGLQALITALFLALLLALGSNGLAWLIVPGPDEVAGEMLRALAAHREPAAHRALTDELKVEVPPEQLQALASDLESRLGTIDHVGVETLEEQESQATVRATLRAGPGDEHALELPLVKRDGLWHVASLEPVRALTR